MHKTSPKYVVLWRSTRKGLPNPQSFGGRAKYKHDEWEVYDIFCTEAAAIKARKEILTPAEHPDDRIWDSRPEDVFVFPLSAAISFP